MNASIMEPSLEELNDKYTGWYGFDTENDQNGKVTITCLVHESGARKIWRKAGEFKKWCESRPPGERPIVICHNLEYDLVNEFGSSYPDLQLNYLKGRLISAKCGRVTFHDSFNHFKMTLKKLGEAFGITKLDMDINSEDYVATDAWICLKAMTSARDFIAGLGGQIGATSGSSAMSVWRYMTEDEYCTGPFDTPWLRRGYYGGRTEIFRRHTYGRFKGMEFNEDTGAFEEDFHPDIHGYDVNSMFPFCMLNDYPESMMDDPKFEKAKGMAEVTISVPHDLYVGPLPHRSETGALLYPVGVFDGVWTYDEIRLAESMGSKVIAVHKAVGCNVVHRPFDQFIHTLYDKRKVATFESDRLFLKVLMNSLYGKIASKNQVTRTVSRYNLVKSGSTRLDEVKWISYHRGLLAYYTPQQPYVNVLWGSMITAYARMLLTQYLAKVPPENLCYCDTDSIYCLDYKFPVSNEIGGVKLEKKAGQMHCLQPKAYQLDDQYTAKGVPRPRYDKDGSIIVDYAKQYMEEGFTEFQAPIRFRASINSKRGKANQWVTHSKSRKSDYKNKILSGERYFPPLVGKQTELFSVGQIKQMKTGKQKKT